MNPMERYKDEGGPPQEFCAQCHGDFIRDGGIRKCGTCGLTEKQSVAVMTQQAEQKRLARERNERLQKAIDESNRPAIVATAPAAPAAVTTAAADVSKQPARRK